MKSLYAKIMPFIMLGIGLVALFFGLMLLAYLFVFGAILGLILFVVSWVKMNYFAPKKSTPPVCRGRTIDHEE
jgi:hypothetical protein